MRKYIRIISASILTIAAIVSCRGNIEDESEDAIFTLDKLNEAIVAPMTDDLYKLSASLSGRGYAINLTIVNKGLEPTPGTYQVKNDASQLGDCIVTLNDGRIDMPVNSGTVVIACNSSGYTVDISLSSIYEYRFRYEGEMSFSLDFEPSEETFFVMEANVTTTNQYWQTVIVNGVMKYAVTVVNPEGKDLACIEFVSYPDKVIADLVGTYDVKSSATSAGNVIAGGVSWGTGSGSYFVDESGVIQYITAGKITLSTLKGDNGIDYYTISGSGLTTMSQSGAVGTGSLRVKNVAEKPLLGTVERDHIITSSYMGRQMKYSIYLPGGYDGIKEFPVLWLLHGYGDDQNSWLDKGNLVKYADSYEKNGGRGMIIVTPDGLTEFYVGRYENYFFEELMVDVEKKFRVKADSEYRMVAGLSMGGYGSLYYWLKHPDMFCYSYPMSAAIEMGEAYPSLRDLVDQANVSELPGMTLEMGLQDYTTGDGKNFHNYLTAKGVKHDYITRDGSHDWKFWQEALPKVLTKAGETFAE